MEISIITPYYETYEETIELAKILIPQLDDKIEWIIIDDGCNETRLNDFIYQEKYKEHWNSIHIWHSLENSGGASIPRNIGLETATGEYISFIDSDDLISNDYIQEIRQKISKKPDIIFISWKSKKQSVIMTTKPPKWNCAVWCRVYKRKIINDLKFDVNLRIAEDWRFNNHIKYKTSCCINKPIYFYNIRENSLIRSAK